MDKITVVCHKDHDKGYEDFQGKCLLCVIDELMLEMGSLMIQKQRAERREWVGLTDEELLTAYGWIPAPGAPDWILNGAKEELLGALRKVEAKLKEKNGA